MSITLKQYLAEPSFNLTARQREIAEMVTKGYSNAEIASNSFCTEKAVKLQLTKIYKAMDVKSRAQLIVKCLPYINVQEPSITITNEADRPFGLTGERQVCSNSLAQNAADPEIDQHLDQELREQKAADEMFTPDLSKLVGSKERPTDEMWTGQQMPNGTWVSSQEICYEIEAQRRRYEAAQFAKDVLTQADHSPTPYSMYVAGIASDAQEALHRGDVKLAMMMMDEIKIILNERIATKDEHGRHDYAPGEQARKTQAKLEYLAKRRNA